MSSQTTFQYLFDAVEPPRAKVLERAILIEQRSILVVASSIPHEALNRIAKRLRMDAKGIDWVSMSDGEALISAGSVLKIIKDGQNTVTLDFSQTPISRIKSFTHWGAPSISLHAAFKPDKSKHRSVRLDFAGNGAGAVRNRVFRLLEPANRISIGIFGATGVGKSTLINAILGSDRAPTRAGRPGTKGVHLYVTPDQRYALHDIEGWDATEGKDAIERILGILRDLEDAGRGSALDSLWYCINSGSSRNMKIEEELVRIVERMGIPVQLVITRASKIQDTEFESKLKQDPLATLLKPNFVRSKEEYRSGAHGVEELLMSTRELVARVRF
jgi:GTP-binding protein EngB required for normal cell division